MEVQFSRESALEYSGDAVVIGMAQGVALEGVTLEIDAALEGALSRMIDAGEIKGKQSEVTLVHTLGRLPATRVAVVGLGELGTEPLLAMRRAAGAAARVLQSKGCRKLAMALHTRAPQGTREEQLVRAIIEGMHEGSYRAGECKSKEEDGAELETIVVLGVEDGEEEPAVVAGRAARVAGEVTNYARRLVNLPPNKMTPRLLAEEAVATAEATGLEVEVLEPDQITALGMGAFAAVARGSEEPACLIVLRHKKQADGPCVAFVGKGLTFDSGGLSLKPSDKMTGMKQDMAGGAAVLAAMKAVAELDLNVDVMGLIPATENLPSGRAFRPDDVLTALNGKTIEIGSTDAEGRLILADALTYACQLGATHVIDVATLTGACIIALGHAATGVMGNDTALVEAVIDAGERAGERMWRLPLFPEYRKLLDSEVADLKNVGGRAAGTITAGWFLREFVADTPWVHMDVAGTAFADKGEPYRVAGATGAPTRTLVALAERLAGGVG
ncbi:MAG: leucyl aminopeptidase [Armatimonadetes bacterium]|nr:leucyl aminopeptidase [Armatimonadota bacterium]